MYPVLLVAHLVSAILWIGGGVLIQVLATRAQQSGDPIASQRILNDVSALSMTYFVPASLGTLLFGVLMVLTGPWSFGQLWIILGLVGYLATFLTGILVFKPESERIAGLIARAGGKPTAESTAAGRRLLTLARIDFVVLFVVVVDMATKPAIDSIATLVVMALILAVGVGYFLLRAGSFASSSRSA